MRVLVFTNMYPTTDRPWYGVFVEQQVASLQRIGIEVDVQVHLGYRSRWNYARGLLDLRRRLRRGRYGLIHTHHAYSTILAWAAVRLMDGRPPIVQTLHDSDMFEQAGGYGEDWAGRLKYWRKLTAWALARCDFVIPVYEAQMRAVYGSGARWPRHRVIPMGVDMEKFRNGSKAEARRRLGWAPRGFVVFFPCDPDKRVKRFDLARAGFELFSRWRSDAMLVTAGDVHYESMPDYYRAADVVLMTSDRETGPMTLREALASERPVVTTDVSDVRARYGHLEGVRLCERNAEQIAEQLCGVAEGGAETHAGRQQLIEQEMELGQVARRVVNVYEEVVEASGRRSQRRS